jgi:hypothetical protein
MPFQTSGFRVQGSEVDPRLGDLDPTHYLFALFDDFIEIVADDSPSIEEIEKHNP